MPRQVRIPASGYNTFTNFIIQRTRAVAYNITPSLVTGDSTNVFNVAADTDGDKVVPPGTVMATYVSTANSNTLNKKVAFPLKTATLTAYGNAVNAVGLLIEQLNLRDGERNAAILTDGYVDENWTYIDGVKGKAVPAAAKTDMAQVKFDRRVTVLETNP